MIKEKRMDSSIPIKDPLGFKKIIKRRQKRIYTLPSHNKQLIPKSKNVVKKKNGRKKIQKKVVCCNCGKTGHIYKKCFNPITSIGIICFRINENKEKEFLLVRRKNSLAFSEFLKVKFNVNNKIQIGNLLSDITNDEKKFLMKAKTPLEIWEHLWIIYGKNEYNEFNKIQKKLDQLIKGVKNKNGDFFNLNSILKNITNLRGEPEWGFPKGRKFPKESDIDCAIREFSEETDISRSEISLLKIKPLQEIFIGSNNVKYKHIYYIAKVLNNNIKIRINKNNQNQFSEIGDIKWFKNNEIISKLEKKNIERIKLFKKLINLLEFQNKNTKKE